MRFLLCLSWSLYGNFFFLCLIFFSIIKASRTPLNVLRSLSLLCSSQSHRDLNFWVDHIVFAALLTLCIYLCLHVFFFLFFFFFSLMWPTRNRFSLFHSWFFMNYWISATFIQLFSHFLQVSISYSAISLCLLTSLQNSISISNLMTL